MNSMLEISKAKDEVLMAQAKQRVANYPLLKGIYNDAFLIELVHNKTDRDNILLFWLLTDDPSDSLIAVRFLDEVEGMLGFFVNSLGFDSLCAKLKQWHSIPFESTITELEFASEYLNRGYQVELEPLLPNGKRADFCAINDAMKVFFEVKVVYKEVSAQNHEMINDLTERCDKIGHPFRICLNVDEKFQRNQIIDASRFIAKKLRELKAVPCTLPLSFSYPSKDNPAITVDVTKRLPEGEVGYVGGSTFGGGITASWKDIRSKIEQGIKQLHPDFPGVLIIVRHNLDYTDYDIQNALYGDYSASFATNPVTPFRTGDRIFGKMKNTRLSAVIHYDKTLQNRGYVRKKTVYHNPFAAKQLSKEAFEGENVTQL